MERSNKERISEHGKESHMENNLKRDIPEIVDYLELSGFQSKEKWDF